MSVKRQEEGDERGMGVGRDTEQERKRDGSEAGEDTLDELEWKQKEGRQWLRRSKR